MKRLSLILCLLIFGLKSNCQLVIDNTMTPAQLVQNILLGSGITVSNVTFSGAAVQIAYFDGNNTNLGFGEGVLITTGDVNNAIGPNNQGGASFAQGTNGDPDLDQLAGLQTFDAAILEFDFIPTSNTVNFDYIFASEEYMEFVGGGINDAFGFFISGPGIAGPYSGGSENIALIPGTATQVTIDNVNANTNNAFYVDNGDGFTAPMNTDVTYVQYDGLTTQLTATSSVTSCETYHIKIVIADGFDTALDSGVFLKAGSLNGGDVTIQASTPSADSIAVEGCASGLVSLSIPTAQGTDFDIDYVISGTATNGVDYETINTSVTIPAGDTAASFNINPIADGTTEGTETIVLTIQTSACSQDSVILFIADLDPLQLTAGPNQSVCDGQSATITVDAAGGGGIYSYDWDNQADDIQSPIVSPATPTTYTVTVTDQCGSSETVSVDVNVGQLNVSAGNDDAFCTGNSLQIGENPQTGHTYAWTPTIGLSDPTISNPSVTLTNNTGVPITQEYVVASDDGLCSGTDTIVVTINPEPSASFIAPTDACEGEIIDVSFDGSASQLANYSWNFDSGTIYSGGDQGPYQIIFTTAGTFDITLDVEDGGCNSNQATQSISISASPTSEAGENADYCNGDNIDIGMIAVPNVDYSWSPLLGLNDHTVSNPNVSLQNTGNTTITQDYTLVSSFNGCTSTDFVTVTIFPTPAPTSTPPSSECFENNSMNFTAEGDFENNASTIFSWNFGSNATPSTSNDQDPVGISFDSPGTYAFNLEVSSNGCTGPIYTDSITIYEMPLVSFDDTYYGACVPSIHQLTNTSITDVNADFLWTVDGISYNEENPIVPLVLPGLQDVSLQVTSSEGCVSSHSVIGMIEGFPQPQASFVFEDTLSELYPITGINSNASDADSCIYIISHLGIDDTIYTCNTNYTFLDTGTFEITQIVFSNQGCVDTITDTLQVFPELTLYIPNTFMPDGDGSNDFWGAYGTGFIDFELLVFDRWGNEIFTSSDIQDRWNGTYKNTGQDQPIGVYVYRIRAIDARNQEVIRMGTITLLR